MARPKGDGRGRIGGRVKGSRNKKDVPSLEALNNIVLGEIDEIPSKLAQIQEPEKWLQYFLKLLEFTVPKKAPVVSLDSSPRSDLASELLLLAEQED